MDLHFIELRLEVEVFSLAHCDLIGKLGIFNLELLALLVVSLFSEQLELFLHVVSTLHDHSLVDLYFLVELVDLLSELAYQDLVGVCVHYWLVLDMPSPSGVLQSIQRLFKVNFSRRGAGDHASHGVAA